MMTLQSAVSRQRDPDLRFEFVGRVPVSRFDTLVNPFSRRWVATRHDDRISNIFRRFGGHKGRPCYGLGEQ